MTNNGNTQLMDKAIAFGKELNLSEERVREVIDQIARFFKPYADDCRHNNVLLAQMGLPLVTPEEAALVNSCEWLTELADREDEGFSLTIIGQQSVTGCEVVL